MKTHIDAIIFDYGGVISEEQDLGAVDEITKLLNLDSNTFNKSYRYFRPEYDMNKISATQYWEKIIDYNNKPISKDIINKLIELDVKSWIRLNINTLNYIKKFYKCGIKIAIISNMTIEVLEYMKNNFTWLDIFDPLIFSCEIEVCKPASEIYNRCLELLNLTSNKCLFVDDSAENIIGANKIGLNTFLFTGTNKFINELNNKYILV